MFAFFLRGLQQFMPGRNIEDSGLRGAEEPARALTFASVMLSAKDKDIDERLSTLGLTDLLWRMRPHKASDLRDKVFALLNIAVDNEPGGIQVDYRKTIIEVYAETTKYIIRRHRSLRILSLVHKKDLVTWIPDFRDAAAELEVPNLRHLPKVIHRTRGNNIYRASGSTNADCPDGGPDLQLLVRGIKVGVIVKRSSPHGHIAVEGADALGPGTVWEGPWHQFARANATDSKYIHTDEDIDIVFRKICIWDKLPGEDLNRRRRTKPVRGFPPLGRLEWKNDGRGKYTTYGPRETMETLVYHNTVRKRMFVTDSGHLGSGHRGLELGDQVWILMGNDMPFVLRSNGSEAGGPEPDQYVLNGECYVHGIMDGEFLIDAARMGRPGLPQESFDQDWLEPLHTMDPVE